MPSNTQRANHYKEIIKDAGAYIRMHNSYITQAQGRITKFKEENRSAKATPLRKQNNNTYIAGLGKEISGHKAEIARKEAQVKKAKSDLAKLK